MSVTPELAQNPMFWLMLAVIVAAFTPYVLYVFAVVGANVRGRPVPRFADTVARLVPGRGVQSEASLDEIARTTQQILELLRAQGADLGNGPEPKQEERRQRAPEPEGDGMGRSTAWADRRRSDRGVEARGTGYSGADADKTYRAGTGTRASDRPSFSDELRGALKRLGLKEGELPDVATLTRAYREAAKAAHPDRGGATESFMAVKDAYDLVLKQITDRRKGARVS